MGKNSSEQDIIGCMGALFELVTAQDHLSKHSTRHDAFNGQRRLSETNAINEIVRHEDCASSHQRYAYSQTDFVDDQRTVYED